ncbi:hypothetical protein E4U37_006083, partial [Claviceps purpurea]
LRALAMNLLNLLNDLEESCRLMQQAKCYDSWMSREQLKAATTPSFVSNLSCQEPPAR